jgi:hypothetical protein
MAAIPGQTNRQEVPPRFHAKSLVLVDPVPAVAAAAEHLSVAQLHVARPPTIAYVYSLENLVVVCGHTVLLISLAFLENNIPGFSLRFTRKCGFRTILEFQAAETVKMSQFDDLF